MADVAFRRRGVAAVGGGTDKSVFCLLARVGRGASCSGTGLASRAGAFLFREEVVALGVGGRCAAEAGEAAATVVERSRLEAACLAELLVLLLGDMSSCFSIVVIDRSTSRQGHLLRTKVMS